MSPLAQALSAALIHSVWQGALVGVLLWVALAVLRHRSATMRYAVSCGALAVLVVVPVATAAAFIIRAVPENGRAVSMMTDLRALVAPQPMLSIWIDSETASAPWLAQVQLWALPVWSVGVLLFSVRLVWGCAHAFAVGRRGDPADEPILAIVRAVARRMGIGRPVRVLMSTLTDSPSVLGWLRPVLLLTPATAMGLTPMQLEAVIAHELAHIKRHDYLVNVFQVVAETLFFYHPAVWWTSSRIRLERELCCDDLAVGSCGDPLGYARALTTLEHQRISAPAMAMASTGGPLLYRIQRLLGDSTSEHAPSRWPGVLALCVVLLSAAVNLNWTRLLAQTGAESPQFEVAAVTPNKSGQTAAQIEEPPGGRYVATNASLRILILRAYGIQDNQLVGAPDWARTERFDINAKLAEEPRAVAPGQLGARRFALRSLLAERFKLVVHREIRQFPMYALVMARADRKPGSMLTPASGACSPENMEARNATAQAGKPLTGVCGSRFTSGQIQFGGRPLSEFARGLSGVPDIGRGVIDRTDLTGNWDIELTFTPDRLSQRPLGQEPPAFDPSGPSLFAALQEQLGLKLESIQGPMEVLVVDRVERRPTEN